MKTISEKKNKAFSLIELSVVLVIIGVFIVGVVIARSLIEKSVLLSAQTLTSSSPVATIKDNALWLETSLGNSISDQEREDDKPISNWKDQSNSSTKLSVLAAGNGPKYSNTINKLHAIEFSGSNSDYLQISNPSFLNNTDYTIFVLEKRGGNSINNYFIGSSSANPNDKIALGYSLNNKVIHAQGSNNYESTVENYEDSMGDAKIFTFIQNSTTGKKTYINGVLSGQSSDTSKLSGLTNLEIGKGYTGEIGEIIIFTRTLTNEERFSVEDYLGKKWTRKINRTTVPDSSCLDGVVTSEGCTVGGGGDGGGGGSSGCTSTTITGTTVATGSLLHGEGGTAICNAPSYNGASITYTCNNGTIDLSANCSLDNNCSVTGSSVITDKTTVPGDTIHIFKSSGTITCPTARNVRVLVVAGGGGGGGGSGVNAGSGGPGGGAGGVIHNTSYAVSTTTIDVTVGNGGAGGPGGISSAYNMVGYGANGENSVFGSLIAIGGGGGGTRNNISGWRAPSGGSGGGAAGAGQTQYGGYATAGQGNVGGNNVTSGPNYGGGGGGGAGAAGQNGTTTKGGNGGVGVQNDITGVSPAPYYAGGGGSSYYGSGGTNGSGGLGGGGSVGSNATPNTGGGGGGSPTITSGGFSGGSGVVIVRYTTP